MHKNKWIIFLINGLISIAFFLIYTSSYTLLDYINSLFYLSLFYLLLFLFMYTMKGGFFDGVTFGFRRFNHVILKQNDHLEEWRDKPLPSDQLNANFYTIIKFQVVALMSLLVLLLAFFYTI
jgi:hypothetical protein